MSSIAIILHNSYFFKNYFLSCRNPLEPPRASFHMVNGKRNTFPMGVAFMTQYKINRKKRRINLPSRCNCYQNDYVDLVVEGAGIRLGRLSSLDIPAEVSAYIPRVEVRRRHYQNGELVCEDEKIYNSITVVHAPRHPSENPSGSSLPVFTPATGEKSKEQPAIAPSDQSLFPPQLPTAPNPEQPNAPEPPDIPSQPEPHPPPVAPFSAKPLRKNFPGHPSPSITINKKPLF